MSAIYTGTCFCGAVGIEARGEPVEMGYCHCDSCRRYNGGPDTAYALWRAGNVCVTHGAELLGGINRTSMSDRRFCTRCGGHLMTLHPGMGFTDVGAYALPGLAFRPTAHLQYAETVLPMKDGLPKLRDFPAEACGSGEIMPE